MAVPETFIYTEIPKSMNRKTGRFTSDSQRHENKKSASRISSHIHRNKVGVVQFPNPERNVSCLGWQLKACQT